jgi:bifunctional non-homologous end joining protein LigD
MNEKALPLQKNPLQKYRAKRDFSATPEPPGAPAAAAPRLAFVVQKHAARRLHYDFRLELDGTLKSWAVPKGPSLDPTQRRMAVHVEDHPLEYGDFEGTIPAGHYGAGEVIVWDTGEWTPQGDPAAGYRDGKLKFVLHGHKLNGGWTLVRMRPREGEKQESWLLIKERDEYARREAEYSVVDALPGSVKKSAADTAEPTAKAAAKRSVAKGAASSQTEAPARPVAERPARTRRKGRAPPLPSSAVKAALPRSLAPALATLVDAVPQAGDWIYEIKFDGYRLLARCEGEAVRLFTRSGKDWTERLPALAGAVRELRFDSAWLDGEIVVIGANGVPDFQALQNAFDRRSGKELAAVQYFLFDLPFFAGHDLRAVPLAERRELLRDLVEGAPPPLRFSEAFSAPGGDLLASACRLGLEGLIGKRADAKYPAGRSQLWIKVKCGQRQEFVVGGYTDPQGTRAAFGSLLLGVYDDDGKLHYAGNVGTGFDVPGLQTLHKRLGELATTRCPFAEVPERRISGAASHWVRPELVAEVAFSEWTADGRLRQPVFKGLRSDKPATAIRRETAAAADAPPTDAGKPSPRLPAMRITNPERVVDSASGVTKRELIGYYERVGALFLPHLKDRPVALVRAPDGIDGTQFFQKHADEKRLPGLRALDPALDTDHEPMIAIDTRQAILSAAQMNVIEFHTWNARVATIEQPDRMIFDLDPGEGVGWPTIVEGAQLVHGVLDALGLRCFLKSSGGKGLHVVVPFAPKHDWTTVKEFSHAIVRHLAQHARQRFVAKSGARNRVGRIFVDYIRNGRGATTVAAYSARARPGLGISLPLGWDELPTLRPTELATVRTEQARLEAAAETWAGYPRVRQTLRGAMQTLGFTPPEGAAEGVPA